MKIIKIAKNENGFTAVELLITLFIASVFLLAGYQLYTQVLRDGVEADKTAQASLIVYDKLRKTTVTNVCGNNPATPPATPTISGFSNFILTTTISCPQGDNSPLSQVTVNATYRDGISKTTGDITHAIYIYNP